MNNSKVGLLQANPKTVIAFSLSGTSRKVVFQEVPNEQQMARNMHLVLLHRACLGAWFWYKIRTLTETSGYKVTRLNLNSAGIDQSNPNTISRFQEYNQPLIDFMSNLPDNEKVVLVGHSAGGLSLTDSIYRFPSKIHMAIYVEANMLEHGMSTDEDRKDGDPDLSAYGDVYEFEYGIGHDQPPTSVILTKKFRRELLYQMSPEEDSILASMLLRPGPLRAFKDAQFAGEKDGSGIVPRIFIKTMHDHMLKLEQQEAMIKRWLPIQVHDLESDHSPHLSTPSLLLGCIAKAMGSIKL